MTDIHPNQLDHVEIHGPFRIIRPGERGASWGDYEHILGLSHETVGATGLSMDLQTIPPGAESPIHLHAGFEAGLFILSGRIMHRFGPGMSQSVESGPGEFIYVEPDVPHQSLNPSDVEPVVLIVARTTADGHSGNVVVESPYENQENATSRRTAKRLEGQNHGSSRRRTQPLLSG